ncbi:MAG: hypothetical protein QOF50_1191, partial [Gaiellaceae bacterium]|nr:hypothetical protein [Gaiellaceae bacterium]
MTTREQVYGRRAVREALRGRREVLELWATERARFVTTAMGRCSTAPAATLVTVGVTWAARWRGRTTPGAPAHSAVRS